MLKIGVLASHGGTNLQAIIDACKGGAIDAEVAVVISNNAGSRALERARQEGIALRHLSSQTHPDAEELDRSICGTLQQHQVELVLLAGYMKKVGPQTLRHFKGRIINIHPALLPEFGGPGMYGERVHRAVLEAGRRTTGVTIHLVGEDYDRGPIIAQVEVPVLQGDTADSLAERVLNVEHRLFVETVGRIAAGELILSNNGGSR